MPRDNNAFNDLKKSLELSFVNSADNRKALWYSAAGVQTTFYVVQHMMDDVFEIVKFYEIDILQFTEDDITFS